MASGRGDGSPPGGALGYPPGPMAYLVVVSLIWAFSFGLIKDRLAGLDPSAVAAARLGLSLVFFLPLLRLRAAPSRVVLRLVGLGAVQYGLMYVLYIHAYRYLAAHEVALFTIFTPLWVAALDDLGRRRLRPRIHLAAALAAAGTAVVVYRSADASGLLTGFALVQISNAAFAFGQVRYKALRERHPDLKDGRVFAWLYLGGFAVAAIAAAFTWDGSLLRAGAQTWAVLAWLGLVATGVCFFLWNLGAVRVDAGLLAVMNDAKVPLAVAVSLLVFGEQADPVRLLLGGGVVLLALRVARPGPRPGAPAPRAAVPGGG